MKRFFTFFFALLSACTFSAYAAIVDGTCGDNLTWTLNTEDGTLVISGTGEMADYDYGSAPWFDHASYITYVTVEDGVTSIGDYAFYDCWYLTSITIPESVTSIGYAAFEGCSGLTSITIPNSVTSIGESAFAYCSGLTSITIPNSVTSIGERVFYNCSGLTSITIPNGVTSIGFCAFYGCSGLTSVTIPNSVTSIENQAFYGCSGLTSPVYNAHCFAYMPSSYTGAYTIPEGIKQIADGAFYGCSGLTSVIIPNSVTSIGAWAFGYCSGLTSITIPNSVTSIEDRAFEFCESLTSITIPNSVTSIGECTFHGCSGLTSITVPNSVTSIGYYAFGNCSLLSSITIPNSVTSIRNQAFAWCSGLTSIVIEEGNTMYDSRENCNAIIETATNTLIAGCHNTIIPNSVTSIGGGAFSGCSGLTSITIPNSVTSIGDYAFGGCSSLAVVNVEATTPPTLSADAFTSSPTCNIPCGTLEVYQASDWQNVVGEFVEQCSDDSGDDGDMDKDLTIVFSDGDNNQISAQSVTLRVPVAPEIAGFTFLYWKTIDARVDDVITLQAVYESNTPTAAPEVYVNPSNPAQKLIRNGQVYILHEEKMYTISGQVVK